MLLIGLKIYGENGMGNKIRKIMERGLKIFV